MKTRNYFKNISEENISLKNIDETRNYFFEKIKQNELITKKRKKARTTLNYIEHFLILASAITGCISVSTFSSLIGIPIGITSSAIGLNIFVITAGIKKYKSIIKKKKKKHDKIVLLAKSKLNKIEVLISKDLIDSSITYDEFVLVNNSLKKYNEMKEEIKKFKGLIKFIEDFSLFIKQCYRIA